MFLKAVQEGYKPLSSKLNTESTAWKASCAQSKDLPSSPEDDGSLGIDDFRLPPPIRRQRPNWDDIKKFIPGEIYSFWATQSLKWVPVLALPCGDFGEVGLKGNIEESGLLNDLDSNTFNNATRTFSREVFEDGESTSVPVYPVLHFDNTKDFPYGSKYELVLGTELKEFEYGPAELADRSHKAALKFLAESARRQSLQARINEIIGTTAMLMINSLC